MASGMDFQWIFFKFVMGFEGATQDGIIDNLLLYYGKCVLEYGLSNYPTINCC